MNIRTLGFILIAIISVACSSTKKQAKLYEQTKPAWLKQRPITADYYIGIGIAPKVGGEEYYTKESKKRALSDLAAQINTQIESETQLYTYENNKGVSDYIQRRIKTSSTEFLEGYQLVDEWQDLENVYAYYRLSKQKFMVLKNERRLKALSNAKTKYIKAIDLQKKYQLVEALGLYAECIDILSGYMDMENTTDLNGKSIDLIMESKNQILHIIQQTYLKTDTKKVDTRANETLEEGNFAFFVKSNGGQPIASVPVKFTYSHGFLLNDLGKSNTKGLIPSPQIKIDDTLGDQQLTASIDLVLLGRQVSRNLYVRKLIENQKQKKVIVRIKNEN